jgi:hypothetical protein
MDSSVRIYASILILYTVLLHTGCATQPVRVPATAQAVSACDRNMVLRQVDELLAGNTFEAHYLTINQEMTLSIWLVEPALDPQSSEHDIAANTKLAVQRGISVAHAVISEIPCVQRLFENINPMIVDRRYQSWYTDIIPINALLTDTVRLSTIESNGTEFAFHRRIPPQRNVPSDSENTCEWPTTRAAIHTLFGPELRNAAAYLLIGDPPIVQAPWNDYATTDVVVQAQWDTHALAETDDKSILKYLESLSTALVCLSPPVDKLEVFVVGETGQLLVYGVVPGKLIREQRIPLTEERILLHREE